MVGRAFLPVRRAFWAARRCRNPAFGPQSLARRATNPVRRAFWAAGGCFWAARRGGAPARRPRARAGLTLPP
ncbi:hypothetical protein DDQ68_13670 [Hymenobacter nivis]|uniref:Uncharacterized protein n=1 Tax=Hymenobacter nivis TaxID=1850093 RepID=A0A2Z3GMZ5_9BACT|nr:hypothetical protein DDQ68_13670 [Hymenobacter nivis]